MNLDFEKKLKDPYYLPSRGEVLSEIEKDDLSSLRPSDVWYEIITQELIQWLASHFSAYTSSNDIIKILEIGSWQGRLAHFLKQSLLELYDNLFEVRAIDNNNQSWQKQLPIVEDSDMNEAISSYESNIIIVSWLTPHPDNILPKWFMDSRLRNPHISPQEENNMTSIWNKAKDGHDITYNRRQTPSVMEYILIWPISQSWDLEQTHGYKRWVRWDSPYIPINPPIREKDWFIRNKLDIPTINVLNCIGSNDDKRRNSEVYSFTRIK